MRIETGSGDRGTINETIDAVPEGRLFVQAPRRHQTQIAWILGELTQDRLDLGDE